MKKLFAMAFLALIFAVGCDPLETIEPTLVLINDGVEGCGSLASTDLMAGTKKVGELKIRIINDTLIFDYNTIPEVYIKRLRYHIARSITDIPLTNGIPNPESFLYTEENRKILMSYITKVSNYKGSLFLMAYAEIGYLDEPDKHMHELKITRTHNKADQSYFKAAVTDSVTDMTSDYFAFCLQGDQKMDEKSNHGVKMLSSYSADTSLLQGVVDDYLSLDLVNWLVNQDASKWKRSDGAAANGADLQMAIWKLIERTGVPTGTFITDKYDSATVAKIVQEARNKGNGYKPSCGEKKMVILHKGKIGGKSPRNDYNTASYANPFYQVAGILYPITCSEENEMVWAKGSKLTDSSSAMYFGICID